MNNIRFFRIKKGITQSELANIVGVKQSYISRLEDGKKYGTIQTMFKIANALDVSINDLFDWG